ncbi:F-box/LRR-repeat protein 3-like isoform X2 [Odontomachus brunneus]|uniref:F-box/LRR-repeat protein 3-like isoform X2 n=1 Tax=Odontomachus brunneus TaxID=486640 RepID=UPI0013F22FBD|nr:F-box/LRR-repeat protein 3-like isoform X2 [Odontomachus brunneus]
MRKESRIFLSSNLLTVDICDALSICKRWRRLSQDSWCKMTRLDMSHLTWGCSTYMINTVMLRKVLLKCGRFLKELHVPNIRETNTTNFNTTVLFIISQHCPNLTSIDVSEIIISVKDLELLLKIHKNITKLTVGMLKNLDYGLNFFQECLELNYFEVCSDICFSGAYLSCLPAQTIRTLIIKRCSRIDDTEFSMGLAKLKNLEHLEIWISRIDKKVMEVISNCCTNLKELQIHELITNCYGFEQYADKLEFINLVNLQVLKITHFPLSEKHLIDIATNCLQITYLDISGSFYVNNAALIAATALPKLEYLYISYLPNITSYGLENIKNLKGLVCRGCPAITDSGIYKVLVSSPRLRLLDISYCPQVTNSTYKFAKMICNSRPTKTILKMYIYGTQILADKHTIICSSSVYMARVKCGAICKGSTSAMFLAELEKLL